MSLLETAKVNLDDIATKTELTNTITTLEARATNSVQVKYAELKSLRDNGQLVPGQQYRITDYTCTTTQANTKSAGHLFDIIVTADSESKLNEEARAVLHIGDTYFANSNLSAWKLWYCLDNDTNRFAWADTTNGKGVIYRMIDEYGNDCPYDFKNIQFKRYDVSGFKLIETDYYKSNFSKQKKSWFNSVKNTLPYRFYAGYSTPISGQEIIDAGEDWLWGISVDPKLTYCAIDYPSDYIDYGTVELVASFDKETIGYGWFYTFTYRDNNINYDNSLMWGCSDNIIKGPYNRLQNNVVINIDYVDDASGEPYLASCTNNIIGIECSSNTFGRGCSGNIFARKCEGNTFGNDCKWNTFGDYCDYNDFGEFCENNTFGNSCKYNIIKGSDDPYYDQNFVNSRFGSYNIFGDHCYKNTFGHDCNSNTFRELCENNTFGNQCDGNTLGNDCANNTFGNYCGSNTFGNSSRGNTLGNHCYNNSFGNSCGYIKIQKDYVEYIIVENGNQYIDITSTQTTSASTLLRNFAIAQGVNNSSTVKTISHNTAGDTFKTTYQPVNSVVVSI